MAMKTHKFDLELAAGTSNEEVIEIAIQSGKITGNPIADPWVTESRQSQKPGHRIFSIEYKTGVP